jgi:hypothetical protein
MPVHSPLVGPVASGTAPTAAGVTRRQRCRILSATHSLRLISYAINGRAFGPSPL